LNFAISDFFQRFINNNKRERKKREEEEKSRRKNKQHHQLCIDLGHLISLCHFIPPRPVFPHGEPGLTHTHTHTHAHKLLEIG